MCVSLFVFLCVWKCDILLQFVRWAVTGRRQRGNAGQLLRGAKILQEAHIKQRSKNTNKNTSRSATERSHNFARTQLLRGAKILQEANIKHKHKHKQWLRGTRFLQHWQKQTQGNTNMEPKHRIEVKVALARSRSSKSTNRYRHKTHHRDHCFTRSRATTDTEWMRC